MPDTDWLDEHIELYAIGVLSPDESTRVESEFDGLSTVERSIYEGRIAETRDAITGFASTYALTAPDDLRDQVLGRVFGDAGWAASAAAVSPVAPVAPVGSVPSVSSVPSVPSVSSVSSVEDAPEEWGMEGSGTDPDIDPEIAEAAEERAAADRAAAEHAAAHGSAAKHASAERDPGSVTPIGQAKSKRGGRVAVALVSAAAVIAVALGAGVVIGRMTAPDESSTVTDAQQQALDVLNAPDATLAVDGLDDNRGTMTVVTSRSQNQAVALLRDLENPIPSDSEFQLWLIGKSGSETPVSAGLIPPSEAPAPTVVNGLDAATTLAVTVEPKGGSDQPTTPILVQVKL